MNWLNTLLILAVAFLTIFLEASFNGFRRLFGAQLDLLPGLMVYASLSSGLVSITLLALLAGLLFDSLSANAVGVTVLPLFLVGLIIHRSRQLILREQLFAQVVLGLTASAGVPLFVLLLLISLGDRPLITWGSVWQWMVMTIGGGALTPLYFRFFDRISKALMYQPVSQTSFRSDREIKRSR